SRSVIQGFAYPTCQSNWRRGFFVFRAQFRDPNQMGAGMTEVKETKAQKVERLKREKLAWDHLDEIRAFAESGHGSIPPEWLGTYFRSWGIYTQGDGLGVVGGTGGEGKATQFFMVRIRIPNGLLTSEQVRVIAQLSEDYGRGVADITVRQNVQLHWVT